MRFGYLPRVFLALAQGGTVEKVERGVRLQALGRVATFWVQPAEGASGVTPTLWAAFERGPVLSLAASLKRAPEGSKAPQRLLLEGTALVWHKGRRSTGNLGWGWDTDRPLTLRPAVSVVRGSDGVLQPLWQCAGFFASWVRQPIARA